VAQGPTAAKRTFETLSSVSKIEFATWLKFVKVPTTDILPTIEFQQIIEYYPEQEDGDGAAS